MCKLSTLFAGVVIAALALAPMGCAADRRPEPAAKKPNAQAKSPKPAKPARPQPKAKPRPKPAAPQPPKQVKLPKLVDLGAGKCIPCKMMKPVLEELSRDYKGKLEVVFIDVWENPKAAEEYKINVIPTQIFYDASGKERSRHVGYWGKADIIARFKEHGINLAKK
jgi:thioredoxin 1